MTQIDHSREDLPPSLREVQDLIAGYKVVGDQAHRQEMPRHELGEGLVQSQHVPALRRLLDSLAAADVARILVELAEDERRVLWNNVREERGDSILENIPDDIRAELVGVSNYRVDKAMLNAFELHNGRLRLVKVASRDDLANLKPIWVDLVAPTDKMRAMVGAHFDLVLPDPDDLTDLEATARFYAEDNGEVHLHSDFLLDTDAGSRNVAVAFILHRDILFSVRKEELPVFRLQRLRASTQSGYVTEGKDVLLDLYAADAEYSADALEDVYSDFEAVGRRVLNPNVTDDEAAHILAEIARGEDLNGRIRRNVLDTRRALSFLMRGKFLKPQQLEDARQILRDIESLDGHTSFLFGKINFLMDATVGFININQNKRVSKLTTISVVFMPINILAGIGGMSEFTMMTSGIPWPVAYGIFTVGMALIGWTTYVAIKFFENRKTRNKLEARLRKDG